MLVKALIKAESDFNPLAVSPVGARGLCQIMPASDKWANNQIDGFDIYGNIKDAVTLLTRFYNHQVQRGLISPDLEAFTLASYNAGPGNIDKARSLAQMANANVNTWRTVAPFLQDVTGKKSQETLDYVERVMKFYNEYKGLEAA